MSKALNTETRKVARHLVTEMKRAAHILTKEAKHQATQLERAAVQRLHIEAKKARTAAPIPKRTTYRKSKSSNRNLGPSNFKNSSNTNITPITARNTSNNFESKNSAVPLNDYEYR
jgi:hypothetical protein